VRKSFLTCENSWPCQLRCRDGKTPERNPDASCSSGNSTLLIAVLCTTRKFILRTPHRAFVRPQPCRPLTEYYKLPPPNPGGAAIFPRRSRCGPVATVFPSSAEFQSREFGANPVLNLGHWLSFSFRWTTHRSTGVLTRSGSDSQDKQRTPHPKVAQGCPSARTRYCSSLHR